MRLLFLGHSGTLGKGLEDLEGSYPYLVLSALREAWPDGTIDVSVHPLVPTAGVADYAEKVCCKVEPDVVVLEISPYFAIATVDARMRRLIPSLYPHYARFRDRLAKLLVSAESPRPTRHLYSGLRTLL